MRILVIVSDFPKVTETFAIANILFYLSEGHEVDVFHIKPFRHAEIVHAETQPAIERGFTYPWFGRRSASAFLGALVTRPLVMMSILGTLFRAFWSEPRRLAASLALLPKSVAASRFAQDAGIDHVNAEFASHPATAALIIHRLSSIPFSSSAHMHDIFVSQSLLALKSRKASFVRTISQFNVDFLSKVPGFDRGKIKLIRCGVDVEKFTSPPPTFDRGNEIFKITFVGSLQFRKGCHLLLEALQTLHSKCDWHLTVIGSGPEEGKLRRLSASLPENRVSFKGAQPSEAVLAAMKDAHLIVVPSLEGKGGRSEGIPVVTMEALALRRPLIASRLSGIPELVEHGVTGQLIQPGEVADLCSAIDWTIENYDEAVRLAEAGRARVEAEYDIRMNASALLAMIKETTQ